MLLRLLAVYFTISLIVTLTSKLTWCLLLICIDVNSSDMLTQTDYHFNQNMC